MKRAEALLSHPRVLTGATHLFDWCAGLWLLLLAGCPSCCFSLFFSGLILCARRAAATVVAASGGGGLVFPRFILSLSLSLCLSYVSSCMGLLAAAH